MTKTNSVTINRMLPLAWVVEQKHHVAVCEKSVIKRWDNKVLAGGAPMRKICILKYIFICFFFKTCRCVLFVGTAIIMTKTCLVFEIPTRPLYQYKSKTKTWWRPCKSGLETEATALPERGINALWEIKKADFQKWDKTKEGWNFLPSWQFATHWKRSYFA